MGNQRKFAQQNHSNKNKYYAPEEDFIQLIYQQNECISEASIIRREWNKKRKFFLKKITSKEKWRSEIPWVTIINSLSSYPKKQKEVVAVVRKIDTKIQNAVAQRTLLVELGTFLISAKMLLILVGGIRSIFHHIPDTEKNQE